MKIINKTIKEFYHYLYNYNHIIQLRWHRFFINIIHKINRTIYKNIKMYGN
jgi:hypothetical protein